MTVSRPSKRPLACGARFEKATRVGESCFGRGDQLTEERIGVEREFPKPVEGQPLLVLEGREGAEQGFDVAVAGGGRPEDGVGVADQARQLALATAQGLKGDGAVAEELLDRDPLRVEHAEDLVEFGEERFELGEGVGEGLAAAGDRDRAFLHPFLEGRARARVEGAEDLIELSRFGDVGTCQRAAVGQLRPICVARGQFDVGLAEQGLGAQDRPRAPRDRRVLVFDVDRRLRPAGRRATVRSFCTLPTETPEIRTSDCWASWVASLKGTLIS